MLHRLRHMKQFIQLSADSIGVAAIRESRGTIGRMANNYVAQAFKEAQESILRATTSGLRRRSVKADVIQNFRLKYREIAQESCRDFLHVFEHMIELYEQFYPEKEQGRHEYIDYISALRSGQRNLEIAVSDLSQFQKNALYTANKAATSAVNRFANSFMDSAHASKEQRAFAEKLKAVFDTEQYERAIDMIFRAFGDNVDIEYTDSLGIETDILVSAQQEKNICEELVDIFDQGSIDKNTIAEFLKTYTMQYPSPSAKTIILCIQKQRGM